MAYRTPENTPLFNVAHPTPQEVFDAVVGHAATMPGPSGTADGEGCLYRTKDGANACFIGGLVTDEEAIRMDGVGDNTSIVTLFDITKTVPKRLAHQDLIPLLNALQGVHDDDENPAHWPDQLREVACDHGLDASAVDRAFSGA